MSAVRRLAAALAALLLGAALTGCSGDGDEQPPAPEPASTPLSEFATEDVSVTRGEFCPLVDPDAVVEALGAEPQDHASWANGDRTRLAEEVRDVAHEYGCSWTAADGTVVSAWIFAPPVTTAQAAALGKDVRGAEGCRPVPGAPAYGAPSMAVRCGDEVAFHGLFGDAWLSCSVSSVGAGDQDGLVDRSGRWCVAVARAASA